MYHVDDVRAFNQKWLAQLREQNLTTHCIKSTPTALSSAQEVKDLISKLSTCFVKPVSIQPRDIISHSSGVSSIGTPTSKRPVSLVARNFIAEWLFLARLLSQDALGGKFSAMRRIHVTWEEAEIYASLTNAKIHNIANLIAAQDQPALAWAWPPDLMDVAEKKVHPSLFSAWAFSLAA